MTVAKRKGPAELPPHRIETRRVADLTPAAYNPRKINPAALAGLTASVERFGAVQPIIVNERTGHIVGGHQRLKALQALGQTETTVVVVDLSEPDERALNVTLNNPHISGEFSDGLGALLDTISSESPGLFSDLRLDALLADAPTPTKKGNGDPDDVPDAPARAVTVLGDVWVLGNHRLICGDSTDAATVARLLGDVKPHLMVTDPPYGVEYDAAWRERELGGGKRADGKVKNDDRADWREAWALFPGEVAYVWHANRGVPDVAESLVASAFELRELIIWSKSQFSIGRGHYHAQHEPCWYAVRKGGTGHWQGDRTQSTLWAIDKPKKSETGHSTQKPVECMRKPIENNSAPGDAIYEPFSGSGTTIIAGEQTGRSVYAVELNPPYVDISVTRWQTFTGKQATLDGDGRTFAEVMEERHGPTE